MYTKSDDEIVSGFGRLIKWSFIFVFGGGLLLWGWVSLFADPLPKDVVSEEVNTYCGDSLTYLPGKWLLEQHLHDGSITIRHQYALVSKDTTKNYDVQFYVNDGKVIRATNW